MEGKKAYILPAVAALVLLVLLFLRGQADTPAPAAAPSPAEAEPEAPAKSVKAQIREAVTAAGEPVLDDAAKDTLRTALRPVVLRCQAARPQAAAPTVTVDLEVISAKGIGTRVERAEVREAGTLPGDLTGCVREGMLSAKPEHLGATGRLSTTLEFAPQ